MKKGIIALIIIVIVIALPSSSFAQDNCNCEQSLSLLIRSNELLYTLKLTDNRNFDTDYLVKNHIFYSSHDPFKGDEEITIKPIDNLI